MVRRKTWEGFRKSGLLWFINTILHAFRWAIVLKMVNKTITDIYPARVKFRGFDEKSNIEGYKNLSKYIKEEGQILYDESLE
jgi:hypothetical protein